MNSGLFLFLCPTLQISNTLKQSFKTNQEMPLELQSYIGFIAQKYSDVIIHILLQEFLLCMCKNEYLETMPLEFELSHITLKLLYHRGGCKNLFK